jgi:hypothetical protein
VIRLFEITDWLTIEGEWVAMTTIEKSFSEFAIGDRVELRRPSESSFSTYISGMDLIRVQPFPGVANIPYVVRFSEEVPQALRRAGTEVWKYQAPDGSEQAIQ